MKTGYYFTPSFGAGLEVKSFISEKNYGMTFGALFLAFRM